MKFKILWNYISTYRRYLWNFSLILKTNSYINIYIYIYIYKTQHTRVYMHIYIYNIAFEPELDKLVHK